MRTEQLDIDYCWGLQWGRGGTSPSTLESGLFKTMLRRFLIALDRLEIHVNAMSVAPISLAFCVWISGMITLVALLKAAKIILNLAHCVSAWDNAVGRVELFFMGVGPFCAILMWGQTGCCSLLWWVRLQEWRCLRPEKAHVHFIFIAASHLSSLLCVRPWVMKALSAHFWPCSARGDRQKESTSRHNSQERLEGERNICWKLILTRALRQNHWTKSVLRFHELISWIEICVPLNLRCNVMH